MAGKPQLTLVDPKDFWDEDPFTKDSDYNG